MLERILITTALVLAGQQAVAELFVVGRYPFGEHHLVYIGVGGRRGRPDPEMLRRKGAFYLLDAADSLLCDADSIVHRAKASVEVYDYGRALRSSQIEVRDIDAGCKGNTGPEVLVRLAGPSDDPELVILGFYDQGAFEKVFQQSGDCLEINAVAPNRLEIVLNAREDLAGTMYHRQSFLFDTETKRTYKVPHVFVERSVHFLSYDLEDWWPQPCLRAVPVFFDPRSAARREPMALIGWIREGWQVSITRFYRAEGSGAALVESDSLSGWLNQDDVNRETFRLPAAD